MSQNHGQVWWTELMTRDVPGALKYYKAVCGWHFQPIPMGAGVYQVGHRGARPVVGVMDLAGLPDMDQVPPHWFSYFAVDDLKKALNETEQGGGVVIRQPFEVPDIGRIAIVSDPTGAALGLITPAR
ncbi:VOC family protein [Rhodovulum sulfidophilum]|uniref:VOC family protein n=1 Tax=Rhodovulum sulfidophilum TaxID=35806 RepID=A0ABS1RRN7_RHOSU|nr:VOC family protein [Rhodovulum sulfidophilum]MBL3608733.1 VOC family protein [Rhodovulum sulfidophilum]MCE8458672.1 VOC family protein [Rhodovulum sulfidophilum]